ncbi:MAG: hypothetical protein O7E52_12610 [Candidatus Poribacteria bacterium]|nr:hypothetical protein [Candidatus Poribacteria bacterium]
MVDRDKKPKRSTKRVRHAKALLRFVASSRLDTIAQRVAWTLNNHLDSRNSDITLLLKYWEYFDSDIYDRVSIRPDDLYRLTHPGSIIRARARIQNQLRLFQASPEVRQRRKTLAEEEREKAIEKSVSYPVFAVFADESGKTQRHLIVGSLWILHGPESWRLFNQIRKWREERNFTKEFHFQSINLSNIDHYLDVVNLLIENSSAVSFKVISVERSGAGPVDAAIGRLYYYLLVRGIEHEVETGRGPLPRTLQLWKDAEAVGRDKLLLADIKDRITMHSKKRFDGKLHVDTFGVSTQKEMISFSFLIFLQVASTVS